MRQVSTIALFLSALCNALMPAHASDSTSNAPKPTQAEVNTNQQLPGGDWIDIISAQGPVGIAELSDNLAQCGNVELAEKPKDLKPIEGHGVVAALTHSRGGSIPNIHSEQSFGDCQLQLEFLIAKGSNSGVKLQGRYEIQLYDSHDKEKPNAKECGGVYPHWVFRKDGKGLKYIDEGVPPSENAALPAGEWQTLEIVFRAPRFQSGDDDRLTKSENAHFVTVTLNGTTIHEDVELDSPTGNASNPLPEVTEARLMFQLDHGAVAFRNVRVRRLTLLSGAHRVAGD